MPKAKPVSLHPLNFEEAVKALIKIDPEKVGIIHKRRKSRPEKQNKPRSRNKHAH